MSTITPPQEPSIAVILCSTRQPRVCPQIADFVIETFKSNASSSSTGPEKLPSPSLQLIDLSKWNLPMFDEPTIPSQIKDFSGYKQPHTRAWSQEIQKYSAFIFILPQYNWGYPAVIKNAIDYLFNEWVGKPSMIVSYGGHGGSKAAAQFRQVLDGVHMRTAETMPALTFPDKTALVHATKGESLGKLGEGGIWDEERKDIWKALEELLALVSQG